MRWFALTTVMSQGMKIGNARALHANKRSDMHGACIPTGRPCAPACIRIPEHGPEPVGAFFTFLHHILPCLAIADIAE